MAYTPEQKTEMYASVSDKLAEVAVELLSFVDDADDPETEDVSFARSTATQLTNLVGNFNVRAKAASATATE